MSPSSDSSFSTLMGRWVYIPPELWEEIMSWLSPESLKRLKLVNKCWYLQVNALMRDPQFIAKHLLNMKTKMLSAPSYRFRYIKTVCNHNHSPLLPPLEEKEEPEQPPQKEGGGIETNEIGRYFLVFANDDLCGCDFIYCNEDDHRRFSFMDYEFFKLASQCDGIICFVDLGDEIVYLMNPALRELRTIHCSSRGTDHQLRGVGFGYDSRAGEYKVVAFTNHPEDEYHVLDGPYRAEVYSLGAGSWSEIEFGLDLDDFRPDHLQVYCEGVYYWCHWSSGWEMFSYDFGGGAFRYVPLPNGIRDEVGWQDLEDWARLCVWTGSVVLFVHSVESPIVIDMWVLDSRSYKWSKHVSIGPLEGIRRPLGFWDEVELFLEGEDCEIKFYHLGYQMVSRISKKLDWLCGNQFVVYQKSLVSVLRKQGRRSVVQM